MNIAVLLTFDQSLSKWKKDGHFDREIRYYKALYEKYKIKTTFISYGHKAEKDLISKYHFLSSIQVYEKIQRSNSYLIRVVKSFFIFFFIHKDIKDSSIIKSNQLWGTWVIFLFKFFSKKKIIIRCGYEPNQNLEHEKGKIFLKIFSLIYSFFSYRFADQIIVTTPDIKKYIKDKFYLKKKISVISNYIDTNKFHSKNKRRSRNKILFVGRNSPEKNLNYLLTSIKKLPIQLDILGQNYNKKVLAKLRKKLNLNIKYLGTVDNSKMPDIYNNYNLYISTSNYEGNPKTILEAMSCGCVTIARDVQGCNSIINNKVNGFLVKNQIDLRNLVKKNIMRVNNKIKKNAMHFIKKKYNINSILLKEFKILKLLNNETNYNNVVSKKMWFNRNI